MPQVPIFQGGIPRVPDNGGSGRMIIQAPRPTVDYERTFQAAMQPIRQGVDAVGKMIEVEQARRVKALSDEAETAYMEKVRERMYGPDGFMAKQGKNASESFQPTVEGLRKDMSDILGAQAPVVRDAVQSRLQDRYASAEGQAMRWNSAQTQAWHLQSSQSRMQALVDDAAQHYADGDYQAKSWLSVAQELQYQGRLQGWDEDTLKQQVAAHYDLFQANRFQTWAQDSPLQAFAALREEKGRMSADVWGKMDRSLWQSSKGLLALELSERYPNGLPMERVNLAFRTDVPLVDGLSNDRKAELFSALKAKAAREASVRKSDLKRAVDNSLELISMEGGDPNPLSKDLFVEAYGEKDGEIAYQEYQSNFTTREKVFTFQALSNADIAATVDGMRPVRGSETYAVEAENYRSALRAAEQVVSVRKKDPIGAAVYDSQYGISTIQDWSNPQAVRQELNRRSQAYEQIASDYQTRPALLTENEEASLLAALKDQDPEAQSVVLQMIAEGLNDDRAVSVLGDQLGEKHQRYGTAMYLMSKDPSLGPQYLKGKAYLSEGRVKVTKGMDGSIESFRDAVGDSNGVLGLTTDTKVRERIVDAAQGLWGYGQISGAKGFSSVDDAVEKVVGPIEEWNGKKIIMPSRAGGGYYDATAAFSQSFSDLFDNRVDAIRQDKKGAVVMTHKGAISSVPMPIFATLLQGKMLQSIEGADGRFYVLDESLLGFVRNEDGSPYIFDVFEGVDRK